MPVIKEKQNKKVDLVVHDIRMVSVDRTMKDIATFRNALVSAESVYYPNRTRLYDLYEDVKLDGHLTGIINKRIDSILNKNLRFVRNNKQVDEFETLLNSGVFRKIKKIIIQTIFHGISGMEFIPNKEILFEEIPRKHIKPESNVIAVNQSDFSGTDYTNISNIWVIGEKRDFGLLLQCSVYAIYKKGGFADYAQYNEIFGQPIRVFKYDANDIKTKTQLAQAAQEAGSSLALIIPKQAEFEIMDGKASNSNGDLQRQFIDACNAELDVIILGNTETTGNSNGGSNAKAKEQGKQQDEIIKSDMQYLLSQLNTPKFLAILQSYGYNVNGGCFSFEKEVDLTELQQKSIIDTTVVNAVHLPVADDYWYETYGIAKPDNYDELKAQQEEEKKQQQQQFQEQKPEKENPKTEKKPNSKPTNNLSAWDKLRIKLADFFDQAHND